MLLNIIGIQEGNLAGLCVGVCNVALFPFLADLPGGVPIGGDRERKQRKGREKGPHVLEGRRRQNEQTVLLFFDPLQQLVDEIYDVVPVDGRLERGKQFVRLGNLERAG